MRTLLYITVAAAALFCTPTQAAISNFAFTLSVCTGTCDSFSSLQVGTQIYGAIDLSTQPNQLWDASDLSSIEITWFDPSSPLVGYTGDNWTDANPLPVAERLTIGSGPIGLDGLTTGGTTNNSGWIDSGTLLFAMDNSPFSIDLWLIIQITSVSEATIELCLFYEAAGCIEGATQVFLGDGCFNLTPEGCGGVSAIPLPPALWLFGSALLLLQGRRTGQS